MSTKKIVFLFLALLLPVCIFLFLKIFGENRFNVPPLHQDEVHGPPGCGLTYDAPYTVPDSAMRSIRGNSPAEYFLLNFSADKSVPDVVNSEVRDERLEIIAPALTENFKTCVLLLPAASDLVLLDSGKRIRGYYESADQDEMDRLIVELKILLKRY